MTELRKKLNPYLGSLKRSLLTSASIALIISLLMHGSAGYYISKIKPKIKHQPIQIEIKQKPKPPTGDKKAGGDKKKVDQKKVQRDLNRIIPKALKAFVAKMQTHTGKGYYGLGYYEGIVKQVYYNGGLISGVTIGTIEEGYAADTGGLKNGDVVIFCDGHWGLDANNWIRGFGPTPIVLMVYRDGQVLEFHLTREWISEEPKAVPQRSVP